MGMWPFTIMRIHSQTLAPLPVARNAIQKAICRNFPSNLFAFANWTWIPSSSPPTKSNLEEMLCIWSGARLFQFLIQEWHLGHWRVLWVIALSHNLWLPRSNYSGGGGGNLWKGCCWSLQRDLQCFLKTPLNIKEIHIIKTKRHTCRRKHKLSCWAVEPRMPSALHGMEEADYAGTSIS